MLRTVELSSGKDEAIVVIWMHGLGADGHDFEPIVPHLQLPFAARFVFPHAPVRPVTINGGLPMRAWYDVLTLARAGPEDAAGIRSSAAAVRELIDAELGRGFHSEQVFLAGFSQGGAIALHAALREPRSLGGVLALSTYLPLADTLEDERSDVNRRIPIFMGHGDDDPVVPIAFGEASRDQLVRAGYDVAWHAYRMSHGLCADEIGDLRAWLARHGAPGAKLSEAGAR